MGAVYVKKGMSYTLPDCGFDPPSDGHYYFKGWLINGKICKAGTDITPTADTVAAVQWQKYYYVRYHPDNGTA